MASLGEDLRTLITGSTAVAAVLPRISAPHVVEQNRIPENPPVPRIWFQRAAERREKCLSGEDDLRTSTWDLEVLSDDDDEALEIADAVKTRLNGYDGLMGSTGSTRVQLIEVEDHDDDYLPRGVADENEAVAIAALRITLYTS